ncbi:MAG: LytR/AlgR family response regulator transcription factor [Vicingaceae bacterium]
MKFKNITLVFIAFLAFIIFFDAFQQHYYLTNFNILEDGTKVSISTLIVNHFLRWLIWAFSCFLLIWFSRNIFSNTKIQVKISGWFKISIITLLSWLTAITLVSLLDIYLNGTPFSFSVFIDNYIFFIVQKGISFIFAYCILILTLFNHAKNRIIEAQWMEISTLRDTQDTSSEHETTPVLNIKIGNRIKIVSISDLTWIEADDYCVQLHTKQKSYTLRKSLKSLEEQLAPYQFVRVHRRALLNLSHLDHVDFKHSVVKLQDTSELPLSKSGAQTLRKVLKANSI